MSFLPHGSNPNTAAFTCNTCGIRFAAAEFQRMHMKTDWHKYNLKRRVADLPSISSEVFAEKLLQLQQRTDEREDSEDELGFYVHHRRRPGKGERQLTKKEMRLMAKKKLRKLEPQDEKKVGLEGDNNDDEAVLAVSLVRSQSPALSVTSVFSEFSLGDSLRYSESESNFDTGSEIPYSEAAHSDWYSLRSSEEDKAYSEDSDKSFIEEDSENLLPNHFCFYCGENNHELERNIRHMSHQHGLYIPERSYLVDLNGLMTFMNEVITIDHECLTCGFRGKSLESIRQHMRSKGHCLLPYESADEREAVSEFYDFSNDEVLDSRVRKLRAMKIVSFSEPSPEAEDNHGDEEETGEGCEYQSETTLVLPSGYKVRNRSMVRYFRQKMPGPRQHAEASKTVVLVDRRFAPGITALQIIKQEREMKKLEQKARNLYERRTKSGRDNFRRHFRDELLGA